MRPGTLNLEFTRGDTFAHTLTFVDDVDPPEPIDYSAMAWTAQMRPNVQAAPPVAFTIDDTGSATGIVTLGLTSTVTTALENGSYVWDLQRDDGTAVVTVLAGVVFVHADVTR